MGSGSLPSEALGEELLHGASGDVPPMAGNDNGELLVEWAACQIQHQWRRHRSTKTPLHEPRDRRELCCACFTPIPTGDASQQEATARTPPQLFCTSCKSTLRRGHLQGATLGANTDAPKSISSPLPKLSLLVQTEAKYQEQLRTLRQQQELLRQQQHEIELRKKAQAETLALEKKIARQRRKEFEQLMARRQVEETRRLQEHAVVRDKPGTNDPKPRLKTRPPAHSCSDTPVEATSVIEPTQLRRYRIPAPHRSIENEHAAASRAAQLAERAAQEHRRKQKIETLKCYAQDLTPLIHGNKPKTLPLPAAPHAATPATKTRQKKPLQKSFLNPRLAPLHPEQKPNNQVSDSESSPTLRVAIPRQSCETYTGVDSKAAPTPLTAEIKPVAWMHELISADPILAKAHVKTQLSTLYEGGDRDDSAVDQTRLTATAITTSQTSGQRVTLASLGAFPTPLLPVTPPPVAPTTYSSERLASLLQKYNVSVSQSQDLVKSGGAT